MDTKHLIATPVTLKDNAGEGAISAAFSIFGMVDSDQDIVTAQAFQSGQEVPMVWAHDWTRPVGKGVIRVEPDRAVFDGQFFMDTPDGVNAYKTVKNMGGLQQYSWGFRVTDAEYGEKDGTQVRYIKGAEVYEVSPVLVGANSQTHTLSIKSAGTLRASEERLLADAAEITRRYGELVTLEAKEGRALSQSRRDRIAAAADGIDQMRDGLSGHATALRDLLTETEPTKSIDIRALYADWQRTEARLNGVAV